MFQTIYIGADVIFIDTLVVHVGADRVYARYKKNPRI